MDAAINLVEITEIRETSDQDVVNELLEEGWVLYAVTRGNLKFCYLLVKL